MSDGLYSEKRVVYELIEDDMLDEFGRRFLKVHLTTIRSRKEAVRLGLLDAKLRHADAGPITAEELNRSRSRLLVTGCDVFVIELRYSYLVNARYATAAGKYGIKGMSLDWDTAIWSLLRELEKSPNANPLTYPSAGQFAKILAAVEFRPEASDVARSISRALSLGHYALNTIYSYTNRGSVSRYLRYLCDHVSDLYERLSGLQQMMIERRDKRLVEAALPESICRCMGLDYNRVGRVAFFRRDYVLYCEHALEMLCDAFCQCDECQGRRFERVSHATHVGIPRKKRGGESSFRDKEASDKRTTPRFEKQYVRIRNYPELGALMLPRIRHLTEIQQADVCRMLEKDLFFVGQTGQVYSVGLPLPFCRVSCADVDHGYVLFLVSNITFLMFVIRTLYVIVRSQATEYCRRLNRELMILVSLIRKKVSKSVPGLVEDPDREQLCDRYRAAANALKRLNFTNPLGRTFFENFSALIDIVNEIPDYQQVREARAREELLLHHLYIKRMYDDDHQPLKQFCGDQLVPYHVVVGDASPRTSTVVRSLAVDLSDRELCNRFNAGRRWLEHTRLPFTVLRIGSRCLVDFQNIYVRRYVSSEVGDRIETDDLIDSCQEMDVDDSDDRWDADENMSVNSSADSETENRGDNMDDEFNDEIVERTVYDNDGPRRSLGRTWWPVCTQQSGDVD
nr:MAG: protein m27 [Herpesviridae sp.]